MSGTNRIDGHGAPSAMNLYNSSPGASSAPDTGTGTAGQLYNEATVARQRYAVPTAGAPITNSAVYMSNGREVADETLNRQGYYIGEGYPVKYDVPKEADERFQARQIIRQAAAQEPGLNDVVKRTDPITEGEVDMLMAMKKKGEVADFDTYVASLVDPRKPGSLKWLMEIYPDFVKRRLQQVHTDYEYALRNQMIDMWGMNTFDDLHFKYMVDQGKISGPELKRPVAHIDNYAPGLLSPWSMLSSASKRERAGGLKAPFDSARYGARPRPGTDWRLGNGALNEGRDEWSLAQSMYSTNEDKKSGPGFYRTDGTGKLGFGARRPSMSRRYDRPEAAPIFAEAEEF